MKRLVALMVLLLPVVCFAGDEDLARINQSLRQQIAELKQQVAELKSKLQSAENELAIYKKTDGPLVAESADDGDGMYEVTTYGKGGDRFTQTFHAKSRADMIEKAKGMDIGRLMVIYDTDGNATYPGIVKVGPAPKSKLNRSK